MRPREMLASSTFYFLFAALFCCSFYANMFYNLYKTFAETFIDDDFFLARAFAIGSTANAIARVGWGYLTDRTSFQTCSGIILSIVSQYYLTAIGYTWLFIITATFPFVAFIVTSLIHRTPQGGLISN
ncbi:hypothetical protein ANCCEY_11048 [Ancylostoma ceylanicum]|uniref:Uncharacterized protein n=1 Tax=Ancylostoma ceylanicum TaxID=53326 RepID=A0A0D6LDA7_9BILA|nr:hypothetical protein ANCCEY_11048 [Ancylostoma ceylanicum]